MRPPGPRFDFAPVDHLLTARFGMLHAGNRGPSVTGEWWTDAMAGELFGVSGDCVGKWRQRGLSERQADRIATALGRYPGELWPEWREVGCAA